MRGLVFIAFLSAVTLNDNRVPAQSKRDLEQPASAMLAKAAEATDLQAPGARPFRLHARLQFFDSRDASAEGSFLLVWASPGQWRQEFRMPGFTEIRIADTDKLWLLRNARRPPLQYWQFLDALHVHSPLRLGPQEKVKKVREKASAGTQTTCLEIEGEMKSRREICLDAATATALIETETFFTRRYEWADYATVDSRLFPRSLRLFEGKKLLIEARVDELSGGAPDAATFAPPANAAWRPWCADMTPPHPIGGGQSSFIPVQPGRVSLGALSGAVLVYGVLGIDGRWRELTPIERKGGDFVQVMVDLMGRRQYQPATCGGKPVELELVVRSAFPN